jgi:uncharacterized protein YfaT (DUF1175 family)
MRGLPRWLTLLAVVAVVVVAVPASRHLASTPVTFLVDSFSSAMPADGFSTTQIKVRSSSGHELKDVRVEVVDSHHAAVESVTLKGESALISVRSGVLPGEIKLQITAAGIVPLLLTVYSFLNVSDSVRDGTPDFLRLHDASDREAFRRWFTFLAESEYFRSKSLAEVNDCAALLRHSYREALRQHDPGWARSAGLGVAPTAGEIRQYQYPYTPLGAGLFRVRDGSFVADDLNNGAFAQFADAKTLWRNNSYSVGRDIARARPGDLLFFRQEGHDLPFHAMIFLGPSEFEAGREPMVIYHTGPIGQSPGEVRRPTLAQLMNFPDPRWRPVPSNPSFLGVYRWNILRGAD